MKRGRALACKVARLPCLSGFLASIIHASNPLVSDNKQVSVFAFFILTLIESQFGRDGEGHPHMQSLVSPKALKQCSNIE